MIYGEMTNNAGIKVFQICMNYWFDKKKLIISHHLQFFFYGPCYWRKSKEKKNLKSTSDANLLFKNVISVASDNPFICKKIFWLLKEEILTVIKKKGTVDIGACMIHIAHNSFLKDLKEYGSGVTDFIISVYNYLNWCNLDGKNSGRYKKNLKFLHIDL